MRKTLCLIALMLMTSLSAFAQIAAVPQVMNFAGRLTNPDGTPVPNGTYSIRFSLWTALTGGTEKWNQTINPITVRNGTFAVQINTGTGAADKFANNLFLEIKVGANAPLTPRQQLTSVAYAMKADSVRDGAITGAAIANGTITSNKLASGSFNTLAWLLNGNSATNPASQFIGTTDNQPLNFRTNNQRALRLEFGQNDSFTGNNVIGGYWNNVVAPGVTGATLFGGARFISSDYFNRVTDDASSVLGGFGNVAGNSNADTRDANAATVVGGFSNTASNSYSFVGGGYQNVASGYQSVVAGGISNTASGASSMVPGGGGNLAAGQGSFAAGQFAQARHNGSFVWSDGVLNTASTGPNQFIISAFGGVGIKTVSPQAPLHVKGDGGVLNLEGNSTHCYVQWYPKGFNAGRKAFMGFSNAGTDHLTFANEAGTFGYIDIAPNGRVGINTDNPGYTLHVNGRVAGVGTFVNASDARYKANVQTLPDALDAILNLRGVTFDWKQSEFPKMNFDTGKQIGFIAQEVEKVLPELVSTDEKGYKSVAYANVVPVLVEAVKTLKKDNDQKERRITELEARLTAIEAAIAEGKSKR